MRCLLCGKPMEEGSLKDILLSDDVICSDCRRTWIHQRRHFTVEGVKAESDYVYRSGFSSCLLQYKECGDEALKDVFLYEVKKRLKREYRGWTLCMMPSSATKLEMRGFSHLKEIFLSTQLPVMEPFIKNNETAQKKASFAGRQQMSEAVSLKEGIVLPEKIVLCDDVITTGATLKGALHCLDQSRVQVQIYTIAADWQGKKHKNGEEWA